MALLGAIKKTVTKQRDHYPEILKYANENREKGNFVDVTIAVANVNIPANRLILSCCSKVFEKMFTSQMMERYEPVVNISADVNAHSVETLVDYVYTGTITINDENVLNLLEAADYLQLDDVKRFCIEFLESIVTTDTCFSILVAANLYGIESLQKSVYDTISSKFDDIMKTDHFTAFTKDDLTKCISNLSRTQVKDDAIYRAIVTWIKADENGRKKNFPELLQLVNFDMLPHQFLTEIVSNDNYVKDNLASANLVMTSVCKLLSKNIVTENKSKIICVGGQAKSTKRKVTEIYNSDGKPISAYPNLPIDLYAGGALKLQDHIFCLGGYTRNSSTTEGIGRPTDRVVRLKTDLQNTHEEVAPMLESRCFFGAAVFCDYLVVSGGYDGSKMLSSTECYIPQLNKWIKIASTNKPKSGLVTVVCDGCLYNIGGHDKSNSLSFVERLNGLQENWTTMQEMQTTRHNHAAVSLNGYIYVVGGNNEREVLNSVERFDPAFNQWVYVKEMNKGRAGHSACVLNGKIVVIGGLDANYKSVLDIESYDPGTNVWSILGKATETLQNHSVITL